MNLDTNIVKSVDMNILIQIIHTLKWLKNRSVFPIVEKITKKQKTCIVKMMSILVGFIRILLTS